MAEEGRLAGTEPLSALDLHVLLVLAESDLYGYAIMKAVEEQSAGAVSPEIGSLYRVLARLTEEGLVEEVSAPSPDETHRGRPRKYYGLTDAGMRVMRAEVRRLRHVVDVASSVVPEAAR